MRRFGDPTQADSPEKEEEKADPDLRQRPDLPPRTAIGSRRRSSTSPSSGSGLGPNPGAGSGLGPNPGAGSGLGPSPNPSPSPSPNLNPGAGTGPTDDDMGRLIAIVGDNTSNTNTLEISWRALSQNIRSLINNYQNKVERIRVLTEKITELESQIDVQPNNDDLQRKLTNMRSEKSDLEGKLNILKGLIESQVAINNDKLGDIRGELDGYTKEIDDLNSDNQPPTNKPKGTTNNTRRSIFSRNPFGRTARRSRKTGQAGGYRYKTPKSRRRKTKSKTKSKSPSKSKKPKKSRRKSKY